MAEEVPEKLAAEIAAFLDVSGMSFAHDDMAAGQ